jgi:hypothetical protein
MLLTFRWVSIKDALASWFSIPMFIGALLIAAGVCFGAIRSTDMSVGFTYQNSATLLALVPFGIAVALCVIGAAFCIWDNNPDPQYERPWYNRSYISGKTWVSLSAAMILVEIGLILFATGWVRI